MVALQAREANAPRILITEPIAQEGIDLLRYELPEAHIDVRLDLSPEHLRALIGNYTVLDNSQPDTSHRRTSGESHSLTGDRTSWVWPGQHRSRCRDPARGAGGACAQRQCDCGRRTYSWRCCWRWYDIFPPPAAASKQAGGTKAACWVWSFTARCSALSGWEGSGRRWHSGRRHLACGSSPVIPLFLPNRGSRSGYTT